MLMTPDCIAFFGLTAPCTEEQLSAAYRRLARRFHPDAGGDEAACKVLNRMYEQALEYIRSGSTVGPESSAHSSQPSSAGQAASPADSTSVWQATIRQHLVPGSLLAAIWILVVGVQAHSARGTIWGVWLVGSWLLVMNT